MKSNFGPTRTPLERMALFKAAKYFKQVYYSKCSADTVCMRWKIAFHSTTYKIVKWCVFSKIITYMEMIAAKDFFFSSFYMRKQKKIAKKSLLPLFEVQ